MAHQPNPSPRRLVPLSGPRRVHSPRNWRVTFCLTLLINIHSESCLISPPSLKHSRPCQEYSTRISPHDPDRETSDEMGPNLRPRNLLMYYVARILSPTP